MSPFYHGATGSITRGWNERRYHALARDFVSCNSASFVPRHKITPLKIPFFHPRVMEPLFLPLWTFSLKASSKQHNYMIKVNKIDFANITYLSGIVLHKIQSDICRRRNLFHRHRIRRSDMDCCRIH